MVLVPKAQCQSDFTLFIVEIPRSQAAFAVLFLLDPNFKLLFFGGLRSSLLLALVLEVEGPKGFLKKEVIFDICNENDSSRITRDDNNTQMCSCETEPRCNTAGQWLTKKHLPFLAQHLLFYLAQMSSVHSFLRWNSFLQMFRRHG